MPVITRVGAAAVGLVKEASAHHKEKKAAQQSGAMEGVESTSRDSLDKKLGSDSDEENSDDEEDWELDELGDDLRESHSESLPTYEQSAGDPSVPVESVVDNFTRAHPKAFVVNRAEEQPLPCPVIIPQRRPKARNRGFVRAYAPVLGEFKGIDQESFMSFLTNFDKESKASPIFDVINLAGVVTGLVPNPITMGVAIGLQFAAGTAKEMQGRYRTNSYLNLMNQTLFIPHGLFAMVMTYIPDRPWQQIVEVDLNKRNIDNQVGSTAATPSNPLRAHGKNMRLSSGTTQGELNLPDPAPLIFPELDRAMESDGPMDEKKKGRIARSQAFISDYLDRRSQAAYAYRNPNSKLSVPQQEQQWSSKWSDPNHPMHGEGLLTFLSGGKIDSGKWKRERRVKKAERKAAKKGITLTEDQKVTISRTRNGLLARINQQVLYLMVANIPSDEELAAAKQALAEAKQHEKEGSSSSLPQGSNTSLPKTDSPDVKMST